MLALTASGCGGEQPWNVLLITLDTTRADRIGCYGNERIETPHLDRLASEGVRFANAVSAAPITAPSHSTILTGRYPIAHGVRDNGLFSLGEDHVTLAERLREHGYATAAAVGAYPVTARFGFDQGFDYFDDHLTGLFEDYLGQRVVPKTRVFFDERRAAQVNEAVLPWLHDHADDPFFVWVHYFDPHQPFEPPPPYDQLYADDLYDGEIAYADACVGLLLDHLERLGVADRTLVVVVADHGEGLGDHGELTHAVLAYDSTLHVPLIIRPPRASVGADLQGRVVDQRVATVDLVPTVLDLLGLTPPQGLLQGRSLAPLVRGETDVMPGLELYAENLSPRFTHGWAELRVLYDGTFKYIHGPRPELFDLEDDPGELHDLSRERPDDVLRMRSDLASLLDRQADSGATKAEELDPEVRMRLESLGYLHASGEGPAEVTETLRDDGIAPQDRVGDINDLSAAKHLLFAGRAKDALVYTEKLTDANPDSPMYLELHATALAQVGRLQEAWEIVGGQVDEGAISAPLVLQLAAASFAQGDRQLAMDALRRHLAVSPSAAGEWLAASFEQSLGDPVATRAALERALALEPRFVPARVDLAVGRARNGELEAAEEEFLRSLQDAPYYPKGHYNYGTLLLQAGRYDEAETCFRRAIALSPRYLKAHLACVAALVAREDLQEAERASAVLAGLAPDSAEAQAAAAMLAEVAADSAS